MEVVVIVVGVSRKGKGIVFIGRKIEIKMIEYYIKVVLLEKYM